MSSKEVAKEGESFDETENDTKFNRQTSDASLYDDDDDPKASKNKIDVGPQVSLKDQVEKDKDDESLARWKEQLLGSVDLNNVGETLDPEVKILAVSILSPGRPDIVLPIPPVPNSKGAWFTLKEGSHYSLKFTFSVSNNIACGLRYTNAVWKSGIKVDSAKEMLGTFSPQAEPYVHEMSEETTPSGMFARGSYSGNQLYIRYTQRMDVLEWIQEHALQYFTATALQIQIYETKI